MMSRCHTFAVEEQIHGGDNVSACQSFYSLLLLRSEITNSLISSIFPLSFCIANIVLEAFKSIICTMISVNVCRASDNP